MQFVHGNSSGFANILKEFHERYGALILSCLNQISHTFISKLQLEKKIKEIAQKEKRDGFDKVTVPNQSDADLTVQTCWFVNSELLKTLGIPEEVTPQKQQVTQKRRTAPTPIALNSQPTQSPAVPMDLSLHNATNAVPISEPSEPVRLLVRRKTNW